MAPTLYMFHASPPTRSVLITAKAIGLELNLKELNIFEGDLRKPEYLKLNPHGAVPTLVDDDGFTIWDSHVINTYLVSKYAKNDALYPKDIKKRALVDLRLHFDSWVMFWSIRRFTKGVLYENKTSINDEDKQVVHDSYQFLETFLEKNEWMAGDSITLADYSLIAGVTSINTLIPIDPQKYPKLTAWMKKIQDLPEYEVNKKGLTIFEQFFKPKLSS